MAKYRLLEGQHIGHDLSAKPVMVKDPVTGEVVERRPEKKWNKGDIVESETDLVARHGANKFELVGGEVATAQSRIAELEAEVAQLRSQVALKSGTPGDPTLENLLGSPSKAPGGQVSTGFQGGTPAPTMPKADVQAEDLDSMTYSELCELAATEEIDLHGARSKTEALRAIRAAR